MRSCEICGNKNFCLIATEIREGKGRIMRCNNCGLFMQDLDWDEQKLREYYEEEYQSTNPLIAGKILTSEEHFNERIQTIQPIFEQIKPLLSKDKKVLEVGSGSGALLSLCKPLVKKCEGVELKTEFVEFTKKNLGIEAYAEDVNKLKLDEKFDVIIMISTLDHLPTPLETLITLKSLLTVNGKIYIEVPNRDEALNYFLPEPNLSNFRRFFWHRAHLFYFTKETISALFKKAGLSIKVTCRHDYTLKNYLNWYFVGKPQSGLVIGMVRNELFDGSSDFEVRMNKMFANMEKEFRKIMSETFRGDSLCCIGWI